MLELSGKLLKCYIELISSVMQRSFLLRLCSSSPYKYRRMAVRSKREWSMTEWDRV